MRNRRLAMGLIVLLGLAGCEAGQDAQESTEGPSEAPTAEPIAGGIELAPINHSGVTGSVEVDRGTDEVTVTLTLQGLQPGIEYAAHVHDGRCASGGPVRVPFGSIDVTDAGEAAIQLASEPGQLPAEDPLFVQVHGADGNAVACANITTGAEEPSLMTDTGGTTGAGDTTAAGGTTGAADTAGG